MPCTRDIYAHIVTNIHTIVKNRIAHVKVGVIPSLMHQNSKDFIGAIHRSINAKIGDLASKRQPERGENHQYIGILADRGINIQEGVGGKAIKNIARPDRTYIDQKYERATCASIDGQASA